MISPKAFRKILNITSKFIGSFSPNMRLNLAKFFKYQPGIQTLFDPNSIRNYTHIKKISVLKKILLEDGTKLTVDINDIIGFRTAINKKWDSTSLNLVKKIYSKELIFIDIGANIGATCVPIANLGLQIIAFEANLDTAQLLFKNISDNNCKHSIVFPFALGSPEQEGRYMDIFSPIGNVSSASLITNWSHGKDTVKIQSTFLSTLDTALSMLKFMEFKKDIIIKIDVEGLEPEVFSGAINTIRKHRPVIIFENNPIDSESSKLFRNNLSNKFDNYKLFGITEDTKFFDFNPNYRYENAILVPNEKFKMLGFN